MTIRHAIRFCLVFGLLLGTTPALAGEVTHHRFHSTVLERDYAYTLYLPPGYRESNLAYPVLYLLHGSFGSESDWVERGALKETADRLIRQGVIPPVVIVMPGSESWWIDGYNQAARTSFFEDLVPRVEASWQVVPQREWRGVAGLSAGGYGSLNFALERPELFGAAAALSPASYHPLPPANSSANRHPAFLDDNGQFDTELWQRRNYTAYLDRYLERGIVVPIYLSAGNRDVYNAEHHARLVHQALKHHQPDLVPLNVLGGGHTWRVWRASLPSALEWMFQFLQGPVPLETLAQQDAAG
ncbi:alpha/beta hydrolase [Halomonas chromatireducens]|uniref:Endo-1,4-beta-xylanase Z n=1 Tax=Halomonas chromatireducens TaxID=507626 RepID=A0A0X8HB65_9GAMM|nr:alpha/beta hydrolase-fold protein [Halomonas chromatireducens]AMC99402.1 Endo-1,4-beta-xylanase Z precursor [Halomonas chromatireducens]